MVRRLLCALALVCLPSLAAAVPVPYSGQLTESGAPVNGNRYIQLNVYATSSGGLALYAQAESLAVVSGVYHTMLNAPTAVWDGTDRWIGVAVNSGPELTPRVKVGWVPYAVYTPHVSPILVVRPPTIVPSVPSTWTRVDSLSITAPVDGVATINVTGYGQWNGGPGSGTPSGASAIFSISETTPSVAMTLMRTYSGGDGFSVTAMLPVTAGAHTYYFWARALAPGTTFEIDTGLYQGLYLPN